jgi:ComF family protein
MAGQAAREHAGVMRARRTDTVPARLLGAASTLLGTWADLALPRACGACGLALPRQATGLCEACLRATPGTDLPRCPGCALLVEPRQVGELCPRCRAGAPAYDATLAWADYAPPLDRLIAALKFHNQWWLAQALGAAMARALAEQARALAPTRVTWVPLGSARLRERGYNQARALAVHFAREVGWPPAATLLRRVRDTEAQSATGAGERWANVAGAFAALEPLTGERVALIDDVMTTGATVSAAAEALRRAGAREVTVVVAARAALPPER